MADHGQVDVDRLAELFPLVPEAPPSWNDTQSINSPMRFALHAQLQRVLADTQDLPNGQPVDVFCWNAGECDARHLTKTGGLPYLPRDFEWPTFDDLPLVYYGQFCFIDSRDIVGDLPGDVLLIFGQEPADSPGYFEFEWMPLDLNDLIEIEDIPATRRQFKPCYGSLSRFTDYDTSRPLERNTVEDDRYDYNQTTYPMAFHGTKIGGVPTISIGEYPDGVEPWQPPGLFICQLDSIGALSPDNWPFLNLQHGNWPQYSNSGFVELTGHGTLFLYLDDDGMVQYELYYS